MVFEALPFFHSSAGYLTESTWQSLTTGVTTEMDAIGRVESVTEPTGDPNSPTGESTVAYTITAQSTKQTLTDQEDKVTEKFYDIKGRLIQLEEVISGEPNAVVTYEYDILGRLIKTADPNGNEFIAEYDSLGRKIRSDDPDMGEWTYEYDDAGRMLEQIDAKGNLIAFEYDDPLGRVTGKLIYGPNDVNPSETVTYTYDESDDEAYTVYKGDLYKVTDPQGWTKTGYDEHGRAIKTTRYISENDTEYTVQTAYDQADRPTQVNYPGNKAVIAYDYDDAGHLIEVASLWGTGANEVFYSAQGFDAQERAMGIDYGNGVSTDYTFYTNSRRLKRIHTYKDATSLQDVRYTFDKVSNVTNVFDQLNPTGAISGSMTNIQYDDLHRLTSLTTPSQGQVDYTYDILGNITVNEELGANTYTYGSSKPHAVTAVGSNSYTYDAVGNMITRNSAVYGNQTLTYDAQNRLIQVSVDSNDITFGYSSDDARLWKKVNGQITQIWIGGLYEEKDGKVLCHVSVGGQLIATFEPDSFALNFIENQPFLASLWSTAKTVTYAGFGDGRAPITILGLMMVIGLSLGLHPRHRRYNRKRLYRVYGILTPAASGINRDPFKQILVTTLAGSIFLAGIPQAAFADGPTYDPVFYYYHADHLGSAQVMTDRNGEVVQCYNYSAFGKEWYKDNSQAFDVSNRYTGQVLDEDIGLYSYGARYYDQELGRFIQADSVVPDEEMSQALNRYAYVYNNPLKFTDPTGQFGFLAPLFSAIAGFLAANAGTILLTAAISAGVSAAMGGDPLKGFVSGLIGGVFVAINPFFGAIAGGALGSVATGGDPLMGAVTAGVALGVSAAFNINPLPSVANQTAGEFMKGLALNTFAGAVAGGVTAEAFGGDFGQGALYGAAGAAAGYVVSSTLKDVLGPDNPYEGKTLDDFKGQNVVEVRYNEIDGMPYKHAYVVVTDANGNQYYLRGGPSASPGGGMSKQLSDLSGDNIGFGRGKWGKLVANGGKYEPGTIDYTTTPAASQVVHVSSGPVQPILDKLAAYGTAVNNAGITYRPLSANSNAFAHQAVTALGIDRPKSIAFAPGSGTVLK